MFDLFLFSEVLLGVVMLLQANFQICSCRASQAKCILNKHSFVEGFFDGVGELVFLCTDGSDSLVFSIVDTHCVNWDMQTQPWLGRL